MTTYTSATQWRNAAVSAFRKTFADLYGTKIGKVTVNLNSRAYDGAAVSWADNGNGYFKIELFLPSLAPGAKLTRKDAEALAGYWVHEMAHPLYTDWNDWRRAVARGKSFSNMVNALEDVRIERKLIGTNKVPGAQRLLTEITERAVWRAPINPQTVNDKSSIGALFAYMGRAEISGYDLPRAAEMRANLSPGFSFLADLAFRRLEKAESTADVYDIVSDLFTGRAKDDDCRGEEGEEQNEREGQQEPQEGQQEPQEGQQEPQEGQQEPQEGDGQEGQQEPQEGQQEPQEGQQDDDGDGEGEEGDDGDGEGEEGDGEEGDGEEGDGIPGKSGTDKIQQGGQEFGNEDVNVNVDTVNPVSNVDAVSEIIDRTNGGNLSWDQQALLDAAANMRILRPKEATCVPGWEEIVNYPQGYGISDPSVIGKSGTYNQLKAIVQGVGAMKAQVKRIVWAPDRFQWIRRVDSGKFDVRAAARARMGHSDLYQKPDEKEGHKAGVAMLLDLSGSMARRRFHQASMAINVAEAIEQAGCQIGIYGFDSNQSIKVAKKPNQKMAHCKGYLMQFANTPGGSTPLSQSLLRVSDELELIPATEHVLFAFTDGGDGTGPSAVRCAVDFAQKRGQRVVAILMGGMEVKGSGFENANAAVAVADMTDLSGAVLKKLAEQVQKARGF